MPEDSLLSLGDSNYCQSRRVVESAFGILAAKWRILNKPTGTSIMADRIVKCVCVLHSTVIN